MHTTYCSLQEEDREEISRGLAAGYSYADISRQLGRPTSTVCREINRHGGRLGYRARIAGRQSLISRASRRAGKTRLAADPALRAYVHAKLSDKWSPEQVARTLQAEYPSNMTMQISDESTYRYIYVLPKGELRKHLIMGLRQERKYRRKRHRSKPEKTRGKIAEMLSTEERPVEVASRTVPGHWEGDLILDKHKRSALGTLVERVTRFTLLVPLSAKNATTVRRAYAKTMIRLPAHLRKSLTYDQGKEMSEHKRLAAQTGMTVYFARPGSPGSGARTRTCSSGSTSLKTLISVQSHLKASVPPNARSTLGHTRRSTGKTQQKQ